MRRLVVLASAIGLVSCASDLPRPPGGYDAITFKQRIVFDSVMFRFEVPANTTLVADRVDSRHIYFCGLGLTNYTPAQVCIIMDGNTAIVDPGGMKENRAQVAPENIVRSKV